MEAPDFAEEPGAGMRRARNRPARLAGLAPAKGKLRHKNPLNAQPTPGDAHHNRHHHSRTGYMDMKTLAALLLGALTYAQPVNAGPAYDETANAVMEIKRALGTARDSGRRVLVVFGANWCPYCRSLAKALDAEAGRRLQRDFVVVKVDVGQFDKNMDLVEAYDDPLRAGLPGAAVVNADDKAVYTADADELINAVEEGDNGLYELLHDKTGR